MKIKKFQDIDGLNDKDFEFFVRDLFLSSGWKDAVVTEVGKEYQYGDGGVDIFAYKKGRKYAIEVKKRGVGYTVDTKALSQLVTGARLAKTNNMILVTNSYFTSEVKVRSLKLGVELIDRDELQNLWIKRNSEIGKEIKPRKYQADVVEQSLSSFNSGKNKILIEMATGLGKTYTVAILTKELMKGEGEKKRVLFIAHQVEILFQSITAFKNVFGIGSYSFSACFDGASPENTDFVFATFDTLHSKINELDELGFDFIIIDEAHHTPARTYSEVVNFFSPKLLIGLTATPFRADNKNVINFFGGNDGHIGKYDLAWALKHKKLAFPKYLVLLDDIDQIKLDRLERGVSISDIDNRLFLHKKDEQIVSIIEKTVREKNIDKVKGIIFCRNIRHLKHMLFFFPPGSATFIHSQMNNINRRKNLRDFREGEVKYILVCDLFNEGIDIPETNLLVFMRRTGSKTIWLQQLGRGLRKTENKDHVHVLDFVGSIDRLMEVKQLQESIKKIKTDFENIDESESENQVIHDGSLEVHYNDSAAKVLELLENLKYRLATRTILIDKMRKYYEFNNRYPNIFELEESLEDVSSDQVSTYFDSYFNYLRQSIGVSSDDSQISDIILKEFSLFKVRNGVNPTPRAISVMLTVKSLPFFTEAEVSYILSLKDFNEHCLSDGEKDVFGKANEEKSSASELNFRDNLIKKYSNIVKNRSHFNKLSNVEKDEIIKEFNSASIFLVKLKAANNINK